MPKLTTNKGAQHILRSDIVFLLRLISDKNKLDIFPLTDRGRTILKLLWNENKSFTQIGKELLLSPQRVTQIYHSEIRRLAFLIDKAYNDYKEFSDFKREYEALKKEIKVLKNKS